jgi:hypothetical protein
MTSSGPTRPYAGPNATGGNAGRSGEFSTGITGATADPGAESLTIASARYNAQVPTQYRPTSVLQPIMRRSANGMSAGDAARRWADGSYMGSLNATSESSFEPSAMLRLSGLDTQ